MSSKDSTTSEPQHPRAWIFDTDGLSPEGPYIRFSEAPVNGRLVGVIVLEVDGEPRSIFAGYWDNLAGQIGRELARRPSGDLDPGERVRVTREASKRPSKTNPDRKVWPFDTWFENGHLYTRRPREIFGLSRDDEEERNQSEDDKQEGEDDEIPF